MRLFTLVALMAFAACAAPVETDEGAPQTSASLETAPSQPTLEAMPESPPEPPKPEKQADEPAYRITPEGVAGLPASDGKTFATLDDYLAHLEVKGHTDRPFWERMKDGRYRWNTGRGMQFREPKYATREELLKQYGFSE